jgi:hypothetical protein
MRKRSGRSNNESHILYIEQSMSRNDIDDRTLIPHRFQVPKSGDKEGYIVRVYRAKFNLVILRSSENNRGTIMCCEYENKNYFLKITEELCWGVKESEIDHTMQTYEGQERIQW